MIHSKLCDLLSVWVLAAMTLGLIIGETLIEMEGNRNRAFFATLEDFLIDTASFDYNTSELKRIITYANASLRHELSCLSKLFGHPFCDVQLGADDLYTKTHDQMHINIESVNECVKYAKMDFIRNYIARHGKWPLVDIDDHCPNSLRRAILTNTDPKSVSHITRYGPILLEHLNFIHIQKLMEFDYIENFIPFIKDRAISLCRSATFAKYLERQPVDKNNWKETRLLLVYLLFPHHKTDHMMYLQEYISGDWSDVLSYLVFRLIPKEKEHKISARAYACKTQMDRARSVIQEHNTARFLEDYSDVVSILRSATNAIAPIYYPTKLEELGSETAVSRYELASPIVGGKPFGYLYTPLDSRKEFISLTAFRRCVPPHLPDA